MGIFNKLFKAESEKKEKKVLPWIPLVDVQQLDHISKKSFNKTQVIFKHSTRCHISRMVINNLVDNYDLTTEDVDLYYLDLLNYRDVSNEVASKFQVYHESPQMLIIRDGGVQMHASHSSINRIDINSYK